MSVENTAGVRKILIVYWSGERKMSGTDRMYVAREKHGLRVIHAIWQERTKQCFEPHSWSPRQARPNIDYFWRSPTRSPIDDLGTNLDRTDSRRSDFRCSSSLYNGLNLIQYLQPQIPSSTSPIDQQQCTLHLPLCGTPFPMRWSWPSSTPWM